MYDNKVWLMSDQRLKSFWQYHQAASQWFKAHQSARGYAMSSSFDSISNLVGMKSNISKRHLVKSNCLPSTGMI